MEVKDLKIEEGCKYRIRYKSLQSGLRKAGSGLFQKESSYIIIAKNYFEFDSVKEAKKNGVLKDGRSGINEIPYKVDDGFKYIYQNVKTNIIKLRVPVLESGIDPKFYFKKSIDEESWKEVDKNTYYEKIAQFGYKKRETPVQAFLSFNIENILSIEKI